MADLTPESTGSIEQNVLGAVLQNGDLVDVVALHASDFENLSHHLIWKAVKVLADKGDPVDLLTVNAHLKQFGQDMAVYLAQLVELTPTTAHVEHHADLVRQAAARRKVLALATTLAEKATSGGDVDALIDQAEGVLLDVRQAASGGVVQAAAAGVPDAVRYLETLAASGGDVTGLATGFADLDRLTGGLHPGNMVVVAGRPSMGKTSLALNVAAHVASAPHPVVVFSLEMTALELWLRLLFAEARIDSAKLSTVGLGQGDWKSVNDAAATLHGTPLFISDSVRTAGGIRAQARRIKAQAGGLSLLIVDYLQLLVGEGRIENRQQEVSALSRALKRLAVELGCVVMALSQLNRAPEGRRPPRPLLADLRESGAIEQDADVVALLYRDEVYNEDSDDRGVAEVNIAKHRNGPTGTLRLAFRGEFTRFENLARKGNDVPDYMRD